MKTFNFRVLIAATLAALLFSCENTTSPQPSIGETPAGSDASGPTVDLVEYQDTGVDTLPSSGIDCRLFINLDTQTVSIDEGEAIDFSMATATPVQGVVVEAGEGRVYVSATGEDLVEYIVTGSLSGTFTLESSADFLLTLDGAAIAAIDGPALYFPGEGKAWIQTCEGTANTLSDSAERSNNTKKAALYSEGPLVFAGDGSLSVNASYKHGIWSAQYIHILDGTLMASTSAKNVIQTVHAFIIDAGSLVLRGTGAEIDDESKGIKVDGLESAAGAGRGYIVINGGSIDIETVGKAVSAAWDYEEDAETASTDDDPNPDLIVYGGTIRIVTTGTAYENADGTSCSPEGLEAKSDLFISGGDIRIEAGDDCLNAGNSIEIAGGTIWCSTAANDAIDSNGILTLSGGTIVALAANAPEGAFDCDQNTFAVTGGTFVGIGGSTSTPTASACTQNVVVLNNVSLGTGVWVLIDEDGGCAFAYAMPRSASCVVFSSASIESNTDYSIKTGSIVSSSSSFNGLYIGDLASNGGNAISGADFTTESVVSVLGTTMGPNGR